MEYLKLLLKGFVFFLVFMILMILSENHQDIINSIVTFFKVISNQLFLFIVSEIFPLLFSFIILIIFFIIALVYSFFNIYISYFKNLKELLLLKKNCFFKCFLFLIVALISIFFGSLFFLGIIFIIFSFVYKDKLNNFDNFLLFCLGIFLIYIGLYIFNLISSNMDLIHVFFMTIPNYFSFIKIKL